MRSSNVYRVGEKENEGGQTEDMFLCVSIDMVYVYLYLTPVFRVNANAKLVLATVVRDT